eukprot:108710-Chlamydomonas_euryale.AAC.1
MAKREGLQKRVLRRSACDQRNMFARVWPHYAACSVALDLTPRWRANVCCVAGPLPYTECSQHDSNSSGQIGGMCRAKLPSRG